MSNWDDEDWETEPAPGPAPTLPVGGGAGLGNWDDEDVSEEEEVALKKPSAPMKPSKVRALALKKKEEEEQRQEAERVLAREKELQELSIMERKMRQQQLVEAADLENAKDLFMDGNGKEAMKPPAEPTLDTFKPVSDADYKTFATMVGNRCGELNDNPKKTLRYVNFVKDVIRGLTKDLGPDDAKDLATFTGLISNEKRDAFKKSKGYKKKSSKKTHVRVDREDGIRTNDFDDFDGFM